MDNKTTTYIYARTSTKQQNVEQQVDYLISRGHTGAVVFKEQESGKSLDRVELNKLKNLVTLGDTVVVQDISRIGRNTLEVISLVEEFKNKGVRLVIDDLGSIDVTSSAGAMVLTTLAAVATMQREQMLEKQAIGIETAKAEGKFKGKQRTQATIDKYNEAIKYINNNSMTIGKACKAAAISRATYYDIKNKETA